MNDILVMLLAGGVGSRLNILARRRAKPAVPFGGTYRIIDFTLSNVMRAGFGRVGVLTQYRPTSLMDHLGNGVAWDLWGKTKVLRVLPPFKGLADWDWYRGTADAVYQNLGFVRRSAPREVVILSGDHIYSMDYRQMLWFHREKRADATVAVIEVPWSEASRFGLLVTDGEQRIREFQEKPAAPRSNLASMGVYIFDAAILEAALFASCSTGGFDFGRDVIPRLFAEGRRLFAYPFSGYWRDVGTVQSYWDANMDLLRPEVPIDLHAWQVRTNLEDAATCERPGAWTGSSARVCASLVSRGCAIEGTIERSVLSPGVRVGRGAVVRDSIVMHDCVIGEGAVVDRAILDKRVFVGAGARVGEGPATPRNREFPEHLDTGLTLIGKEARLPANLGVGRNCLIFPGVREELLPSPVLATGETVRGDAPW